LTAGIVQTLAPDRVDAGLIEEYARLDQLLEEL
jgi:hypothetical protein